MEANFDIPKEVLTDALTQSLFKGELGAQVAAQLANLYAEVTTYTRTDAAKLLNIARSTLYQYENTGRIRFRDDGRVTLAALLEFQRSFPAEQSAEVIRKTQTPKRRTLKSLP